MSSHLDNLGSTEHGPLRIHVSNTLGTCLKLDRDVSLSFQADPHDFFEFAQYLPPTTGSNSQPHALPQVPSHQRDNTQCPDSQSGPPRITKAPAFDYHSLHITSDPYSTPCGWWAHQGWTHVYC